MRWTCCSWLALLAACQPVPEVSGPEQNRPTADVPSPHPVDAEPVPVPWSWVEDDRGDARQVSPGYGPWGSEAVEVECSSSVSTVASVRCRRYRGEELWSFHGDRPAVSGDVLVEGDAVYVAWAGERQTTVRALELADGTLRWASTIEAYGIVQLDVAEHTLRIHDEHGASHALDLVSGEPRGASRMPADLLDVGWSQGATDVLDPQGRAWSVTDGRLVGDGVYVELPHRHYRSDAQRVIHWSLDVHASGVTVHERVDLKDTPAYSMRWVHAYDYAGRRLGTRRIVSGDDHPGLWELHVVPERTLPPQ